jgi:predicted ferric reductase
MKYRGLDPRTALVRWGLVAIAVGVVIGATGPTALANATRALSTGSGNLSWYLERMSAFLAYLAITGSVIYGLLLSTRVLDAIAHRPVSFTLHQDLAAIGLGLAGIHGALLGLDRTIHFSLLSLAVPFASPYQPVWVGLGQLGFYLTLAVVVSFYARRRIGQRSWRLLHYATFLAFAFATLHGIVSGTDSATGWAWWLYVGASMVVVFLFTVRLWTALAGRTGPTRTVESLASHPPRPVPARRELPELAGPAR